MVFARASFGRHAGTNMKANLYLILLGFIGALNHTCIVLYMKRLGIGLNLVVTKRSGMLMMTGRHTLIVNNTALDKKGDNNGKMIMILCHI